ncbi:AbrB/MazE/SpoVT family DNA-binding domain-containing protein [Parvularcula sp. ZS-1/3]|uniref:AbrB/MazE/SpoVT family DNA-binding domain-containing protein n=1 Tax=Parvularcula mediterranea TaxID=2732508 RepID=A0A7Y3RMH6_9PROT|nr:AbrB/MazE/SpoVT family DNA-binding domain-containing protein [Parvularcula mediterranea]NNU16301.1 AbrB/MazE/SpoVT family DNA-binding domain-containing protein [Parvularcula mediterranea]
MHKIKLRKIGNSVGVVLPKELLEQHQFEQGDEVYAVSSTEGVELRRYDPEVAKQLETGRSVAKRYRTALRELAK